MVLQGLTGRCWTQGRSGWSGVSQGLTLRAPCLRRRSRVLTDGGLQKALGDPAGLPLVRRRGLGIPATSTKLPPGITSVDDEESFEFVDALEETGLKAPKFRTTFEVMRFDQAGQCRLITVKRRDILRLFSLMTRDLRRIDPALDRVDTSGAIVIREKAILLNLAGVRCIIAADRCFVFYPEGAPAKKFLEAIIPKLRHKAERRYVQGLHAAYPPTENDVDVNGKSSSAMDGGQAFELDALEAALIVATGTLDAELVLLVQKAKKNSLTLPGQINPITLEELRRTKQASIELESKAKALADVLEEILDDDDELAEINLSRQPLREERQKRRERNRLKRELQSPMSNAVRDKQDALEQLEDEEDEEEDIEKAEELLEYYLQRVSSTQSKAEAVLEGARDLEESIGVSLSARRFEVNRLELLLSMGSFAACVGAMIAGIFGMNMRNTMEMSVWGFYGVTAGIILLCVYVFFALLKYTQQRRIV